MDLLLDINNIQQEVFDNIVLQKPIPLQGGTYLAKITINDGPILFQTPKSKTKKGIVTNNKRNYCDLIFNEEPIEFQNWIEALESTIKNKIFEKGEYWFNESPSLDDIDYNWNTSVKIFKKHTILRTFLAKSKNLNEVVSVYDSEQNKINLEEINKDSTIITILEISGLKFSASSFHLEYCLRQIMLIKEMPIFDKCIIKVNNSRNKLLQNNETELDDNNDKVNLNISEKKDDNEIEENDNEIIEQDDNEIEQDDNEIEQNDNEIEQDDNEIIEQESEDIQPDNTEDIQQENTEDIKLDNSESLKQEISEEISEEIKESQISDEKNKDYLEKNYDLNNLSEMDLNIPEDSEIVNLKKPNEVYLELYEKAKNKAKIAKINAVKAYLEVKNIKKTYMIDEVESSDDEILEKMLL